MNDPLDQQLSAFLDNELPEEECSLFVRRLIRDEELKNTVNRYALIGDAMRGELLAADHHLSERISQAIDDTAEQSEAEESQSSGWANWMKPVSGLAVAATVAAVAVLSLQGVNQNDDTEFPSNTVADISSADSGALLPVNVPRLKLPEVRPASAMPQSRMDQYLLRHRGYANSFAGQSVMGIRDLGTTYTIIAVPVSEAQKGSNERSPASANDSPNE